MVGDWVKKKFEFLDITTADVAFAAYGHTLKEIFTHSARAMFEVMVDTSDVEPEKKYVVEVEGHDLISLMFNWLNELIFLSSSEEMMFSKFAVEIDEKTLKLAANCYGEPINAEKHELRTEVKAATYHKMEIVETENGEWKAQVILDV